MRILIVNFHRALHLGYAADLHRSHEGVGAGEDAGLENEAGLVGGRLLGDDG